MFNRSYSVVIMGDMVNKKQSIEDKLATLKFICDNETHIALIKDKCRVCKDKNCIYFCPAGVYALETNFDIPDVHYENCLECGTCRISCPMEAIEWKSPKGGKGVRYRFG